MSILALDGRLSAIAGMVREGSKLADVGCDHGLLITALLSDKKIIGGIACDINELPLEKARKRVSMLDMDNEINCRISDGLLNIKEDEADDIIIAGMGGELIAKIISECSWAKNKDKRFILQPMTKVSFLRGWLLENGFVILAEKGCSGANKFYTAMQVKYTGEKILLPPDDNYLLVGELLKEPNLEAKRVIKMEITTLTKRGNGLKHTDHKASKKLLLKAEELRSMIEGED